MRRGDGVDGVQASFAAEDRPPKSWKAAWPGGPLANQTWLPAPDHSTQAPT